MKKLLCIFILTASVSIIFVLLDSCKKDIPCHYIPIESSCEINSKETKFNYCFNGTNMLSENPVFYDLKEVGSNWNDENINISMIFLHRDGISDYYFPLK